METQVLGARKLRGAYPPPRDRTSLQVSVHGIAGGGGLDPSNPPSSASRARKVYSFDAYSTHRGGTARQALWGRRYWTHAFSRRGGNSSRRHLRRFRPSEYS